MEEALDQPGCRSLQLNSPKRKQAMCVDEPVFGQFLVRQSA